MLNIIVLIAILGCSGSPVDPSRSVGGPGGEVGSDTTWLEVNLESFGSTEELREDRSVFPTENLHLEKVFLDTDVAYTQGGLTRSMRYDWTDQGIKAMSIGRGVVLPEPVDELWAEIVLRWSSNFTACNPAKPPCDHKTLFLQVTPGLNGATGRWNVHVGGGAGEVGPEANVTMYTPVGRVEGTDQVEWELPQVLRSLENGPSLVRANGYFNEEWHVVRVHAKHSKDINTFDGRMRVWIDGELLYDTDHLRAAYGAPGFSTIDGTRIRAILLGRNKDKGPDTGTVSMWIGRVRAWRADPGW